ncbi:MAG: hypothetical protein PUC21_10045 [Bacteroidales bacterium]|nr:hypothetical protein [Bacteroidales bacterium]
MLPSKVYISKGYNDFNPKAGSLLASIDSQFADDAEFTCLDGVWHDASEIPDELLMPILILPSKRFAPWMCDVITTAKDGISALNSTLLSDGLISPICCPMKNTP